MGWWHQILLLRLLCFLFFLHSSSLRFASPLCPPDQRDALLRFKNSFVVDSTALLGSCDWPVEDIVVSYPKTNSWKEGADCCSWDGVTCDGVTGDVIGLDLACSRLRGAFRSNSSLLLLRHLRSLNLFGNDFVGSHIPHNLSAFAELTHLNLSSSQFSGTVPSEISRLSELVSLDLSFNDFTSDTYSSTSLKLENSAFTMLVQNLTVLRKLVLDEVNMSTVSPVSFANLSSSLTYLSLSGSHFSGIVTSEICHLSKLVSLDLSYNYINFDNYSSSYLRLENSAFTMLVQNLTALRNLVLDDVNMSMISPKSFANLSSSLTYLSIFGCSLRGVFPDAVFRLPSLTHLDISFNEEMSGILPKSNWTGPLEYLFLSGTNFSGEIPSSMWNLKRLQVLYLYRNNFSGVVEFENFAKLKDLRVLRVSLELNLSYDTPKYTFPKLEVLGLFSCNLTKFPYFLSSVKRLRYLDLSSNRISGEIPKWFWGTNLDTLESLVLSNNLLEGGIQHMHRKRLSHISLRNNSFQGPLPSSICQLSTLQFLDLSNNNLSGNISSCFGNTTDLRYLTLSSNKLQGPLPRSLVKCVNLSSLYLANNEFSDIFPHWLKAPQLESLDLQSNKFHGRINLAAFGLSFPGLQYLVISNNNFTGRLPTELFLNTSLAIIDLSNNKFRGPIPLPSPITLYYSIASNKLTGKIPSLICNATKLEVIDLSNNSLTGSLPRCLTNFSIDLSVLNLRMNYLEGKIPQSFSSRNSLMTLDLSRNRFEGPLPHSLVKCINLEVLDLGDNQIEDAFPRWLGRLPELKVLVLRYNKLKDILDIPKGAHLFPKLHILDLSNNNFSGPLPANLITNLKGMMIGEKGQDESLYMTRSIGSRSYENSMTVTMKGLEIELVKILTFLTIIDLSHNSFQGNIPEVIGNLHSLVGLNLSHNHLTGSIPLILGNLTDLEWLDLSSNKIRGAIPRELGDLASLGYLNLSKNQLFGRIPQDKQLSTFSSDSFGGNPGLCGTPLPKACPSDAQPPPPLSSSTFDHKGHESWFKQKEMWIGYASGIVIGISIAYITFEIEKPKWLMQGVRKMERRAAEWIEKPK